jgi:hypothetical protein
MYIQRADRNRNGIEINQLILGLQRKFPAGLGEESLAAYDRLGMLASRVTHSHEAPHHKDRVHCYPLEAGTQTLVKD